MPATISFQGQEVIELTNASARALFAPEAGGRLLTWEVDGVPVIPWPTDADWSKPASVRGGNPLLFPFIARHFVNGQVGYWKNAVGQTFSLPQHGFARNSPFEIVEVIGTQIRMRLAGTPETVAGFPFSYQFDVVYELIENKLKVTFETSNPGKEPFPYYAGHHFYFHIPAAQRADWEVELPCQEWGYQNEDGSIRTEPAVNPVLQLENWEIVDRFSIEPTVDTLELRRKSTGASVKIHLNVGGEIPWYAVTTWTQKPESDFFCVEPWLGLPNAIHHGMGLRYVGPGEKEIAVTELEASGWAE